MRPIARVADLCLQKMNVRVLWTWETWWVKIVGNGAVPSRETYAWCVYCNKRSEIKTLINKEFQRRNIPQRLVTAPTKGLFLVNEEEVAGITADTRTRKIISSMKTGEREMLGLTTCPELSDADRKMLVRMAGFFELQHSTIIGSIAKIPSLPLPTKIRLLKHLGVDTKHLEKKTKKKKKGKGK